MSAPSVKVETSSMGWAVLIFFFVFWWQSGWYRVDCALGSEKACQLIAAEYVTEAKP